MPVQRFAYRSLLVTLCLLIVSSAAHAISIPIDILQSKAALTPQQIERLEQEVTAEAKRLVPGEDLGDVRDQLTKDFLGPLAQGFFKASYPPVVAKHIAPALTSKNFGVRLNALIIAARLGHTAFADVGLNSLADENPAIRFWAASVLTAVANSEFGPPDEPTQAKILAAVEGRLAAEQNDAVIRPLMETLAALKSDGAFDKLLTRLSDRANQHKAKLVSTIRVDVDILRNARNRLLRAQNNPQRVADFRRLIAVCGKYAFVALNRLRLNQVVVGDDDLSAVMLDAVQLFEEILSDAPVVLSVPNVQIPQGFLTNFTKSNKHAEALLALLEWIGTPTKEGKLTTNLQIPHDSLKFPEASN